MRSGSIAVLVQVENESFLLNDISVSELLSWFRNYNIEDNDKISNLTRNF
jgi:hypothetical protein